MAVVKDEKRKTWTARFRYKDWQGKVKEVYKRGFETKREAQDWEAAFKLEKAGNLEMSFEDFVCKYKENHYPRIKYSTSVTKDNIINYRITPFFAKKKLVDITTDDVIQWQNAMISYQDPRTGKKFTKSYLKTLHNQLSAILNYAVKFYGLRENPAAKVGNMGSEKDIKINFWTKEEYMKFREAMMDYPMFYYCFEVLYWTGIREGELLALTLNDIDFENKTISINKTYHHINGRQYTTDPKTLKSNRVIAIPNFLVDELKDYCRRSIGLNKNDRLFPTEKSSLSRRLKDGANKAGVKQIRVHDLRHSHVSLLIHMGYSAVAIADRVGHESVEITYRYSHMFPSVQSDMASRLDEQNQGEEK